MTLGAAVCLSVLACAPASGMTFLLQGSYCPGGECNFTTFYRGTAGSERLEYLEFPDPASQAALSSDGRYIAWTAAGRGLYLSDSEARSTGPLVHYEGGEELGMHWSYSDPVFAPNQDVVFFNWDAECLLEFCEPFEITPTTEFRAASTGGPGEPERFDRFTGQIQEPAISSEGGRFAFVTYREAQQVIWITDTTGQGATPVTTGAMGFETVAAPSFSPEGDHLTFEGTPTGREPQIYVVDIDGSELVQLTRSGGLKPQWSPDGTYIAYTSTERRSIERIDPESGRALSPLVGSPPEAEQRIDRVILPQSDALASVSTFEPVLRFDSSERWRPLNVDEFLAEGRHRICDGGGCDREPIRSAADLERHATTESYIDVEGDYGEGVSTYHTPISECMTGELLDCDASSTSAIYYRVTRPYFEGALGYRYIDYWFFYRANEFDSEIDFHEGDWEGVTIAPSASVAGTFDYAAFSQHGTYYSYLRSVLRCEDTDTGAEVPAAGTCGEEAERRAARVAVMVAHGDHANYTTPCSETIVLVSCSQNGPGRVERGYDGQREWGNAFSGHYLTLLPLPPASAGHAPGEGPDPEAWAEGSHGWADWPGRWGANGGLLTEDGPESPLNQGYRVVCAHIDNPEELCSPGPRTASMHSRRTRQPLSPGLVGLSCGSWIGPNVAAALCEPHALAVSVRHARLHGTPSTKLRVGRRRARAASAPGLVQLAGEPLHDGSRVTLRGAVGPHAALYLRIRGSGRYRRHTYIARFAHLNGGHAARSASAQVQLTLHLRAGPVRRARTRLGGVVASSVRPAR